MNRHQFARASFLFLGAVLGAAPAALAQTSELYLNNWTNTTTYVVRNGAIVRSFNRQNTQDGPGLVVRDTIRTIGQDPGTNGHEYSLTGTLLGGNYFNPSFDSLYDGAADGTHNWSVAHNDFDTNFAVIEAGADWSNPQVLFVPQRRSSGIAYDATDNTFWITNNSGGTDRVQHYSLTGTLLSEFSANHSGGGYGLALDSADNTLWIPGAFGTGAQLFQYTKTGTLLQSITVPGLATEILGAEFQAGGGFRLALSGNCPGSMTGTATGASPGGTVAFIFALGTGSAVIPPTNPCAGTVLGLNNSAQLVGTRVADANGNASLTGNAPPAACNGFIQALDVPTCSTSNVVGL